MLGKNVPGYQHLQVLNSATVVALMLGQAVHAGGGI